MSRKQSTVCVGRVRSTNRTPTRRENRVVILFMIRVTNYSNSIYLKNRKIQGKELLATSPLNATNYERTREKVMDKKLEYCYHYSMDVR